MCDTEYVPTPAWLTHYWRVFTIGELAGVPVHVANWLHRKGYVDYFPMNGIDTVCDGFVPVLFRRNWSKSFYDVAERETIRKREFNYEESDHGCAG
jgi:hypothetical protein